jgi:hypothetical protein
MGLLFLSDEREDFVAMVEEVTQGMEDLGLGDAQRFGNFQDRFTAPVQRDDMADGYPQPIDHGLAAANAFKPDDVRMLGLDSLGHGLASEGKDFKPSPV